MTDDDELAVRFEKSLECKHSFITELVGTHCRYCGCTAFSVLAEYATAVSDEEEAATAAALVDEETAAKFEATIGSHLCRYSIIKDACVVCGLTGAELLALQREFSL